MTPAATKKARRTLSQLKDMVAAAEQQLATRHQFVTKEPFEKWSSRLKFSSGKWAGKQFEPPPWAVEPLRRLQAEVDPHGFRTTRMMGFGLPKKSGKTELAAMLGLWGLCGCGENSPEIYLMASNQGERGGYPVPRGAGSWLKVSVTR